VSKWSSLIEDLSANATACDEAGLSKNSKVIGDVSRRTTEDVRECSRGRGLLEQREDVGTGCPK
jgi:hypothetical protein